MFDFRNKHRNESMNKYGNESVVSTILLLVASNDVPLILNTSLGDSIVR